MQILQLMHHVPGKLQSWPALQNADPCWAIPAQSALFKQVLCIRRVSVRILRATAYCQDCNDMEHPVRYFSCSCMSAENPTCCSLQQRQTVCQVAVPAHVNDDCKALPFALPSEEKQNWHTVMHKLLRQLLLFSDLKIDKTQ